ncbi:MAG: di-trans,poly-cis-decaprenylcistransferase [Alphaproteobacteria bacterium GM202ARS2]|nr:di-trans,poly-cis-decaprenylcistransferase [Alphaproteobacteria bacterium GM202ARS2]
MAIPRPLPVAVPRHVAIIMDGNGRWAKARGLPIIEGHKQGITALRRCIDVCCRYGIDYLTVFGFSDDNWRRQQKDVDNLMDLLRSYLIDDKDWKKEGVRLRVIGERKRLGEDIARLIGMKEQETAEQTRLNLTIALSYSGRKDIMQAMEHLIRQKKTISEDNVRGVLWTSFMPDPDLLIRTSGEMRLSNFMLWQTAYSEFYFTDTLWPDFDEQAMEQALSSYAARHRRYGA